MIINKEYISLIISAVSLLISAFVAYRNIWLSRAKLDIVQTDKGARSTFIQTYDGCKKSFSGDVSPSDVLHNHEDPYIVSSLLVEVILTNKSSLPISILEFSTNSFTSDSFSSYSPTIGSFVITTEEVPSSKKTTIGLDKPIKYLQPEFTIAPYTSERGYILFWSGFEAESFKTPVEINLDIKTSRRNFKTRVKITDTLNSIKPRIKYYQDDEGDITFDYY